jgi:hypothetical protein
MGTKRRAWKLGTVPLIPMQPPARRYGVLLLVQRDKENWKIDGRMQGLPAMVERLKCNAMKLGRKHNKVMRIEVIKLLASPGQSAEKH